MTKATQVTTKSHSGQAEACSLMVDALAKVKDSTLGTASGACSVSWGASNQRMSSGRGNTSNTYGQMSSNMLYRQRAYKTDEKIIELAKIAVQFATKSLVAENGTGTVAEFFAAMQLVEQLEPVLTAGR